MAQRHRKAAAAAAKSFLGPNATQKACVNQTSFKLLAQPFDDQEIYEAEEDIDWLNSEARQIILDDLESELLPLDEEEVSADMAWEFYRHLPEFVGPNISYIQFIERLAAHRQQVKKKFERSHREEAALAHDRKLYPRQTHDHRGLPVFDLHAAKLLLRQDVIDKKHETMVPSELRKTRPEYCEFKQEIFKQRVYQEVRYRKFINYLEWKRENKTKKKKKKKKKKEEEESDENEEEEEEEKNEDEENEDDDDDDNDEDTHMSED